MTARKHTMQGLVVSSKTPKTVVVKVQSRKRHPKYRKQYTVSSRYKAHVAEGEYVAGDIVEIQSSRPISKDKRWIVTKKVK